MIEKNHNIQTGITTNHEISAEDEALRKLMAIDFKQLEKHRLSKELARQSAVDKLSALGLSPEEIAAVTGA
jgi:hypothetical protein